MAMFKNETTAAQYAVDTLEPVANNTHLRTNNYFYYLCLQRKYSREACPLYLTREGYEALRANKGKNLDGLRLHTDSIVNVLSRLEPESLTVFVAMDQYVPVLLLKPQN